MEIFNAIGLEIPPGKTLNDLAADAERRGEASLSARSSGGTVHGRCWRIGLGLEVWTTAYESASGELTRADCRPGFRARYSQTVGGWSLFEDGKEASVSGAIETGGDPVFFQLQNLTEVAQKNFEREFLTVGLCGLAYRAEVSKRAEQSKWQPRAPKAKQAKRTDWRLAGRIIKFEQLRNPVSGHDLFWLYLDLGNFRLEILVNRHILKGEPRVGAWVKTDVWLQGHIVSRPNVFSSYEGVDWSANTTDFWKNFKKLN